ncbi:hypothetical protein FC19_GL001016 [Liquorilactobacillus aquaticus DSM 21051]|uniref:Multitransmembrane protein n=1 Tax=Liquorilactobacillus aquaticus DSM 21051 TaxID=1423725 RepID=A0A0R2CWF5_9LACO|nr:YibE/F family protein [Liquorilactobacillus aquaticus]KRM96206.1 hypothetical protein FC19_GL001016 [Liquorilactobacillus aquaticus DSM 21051]
MKVKKKDFIKGMLIVLSGCLLYLFVVNDAFLYKQPILKITRVKNSKTDKIVDEFKNRDQQTSQIITGKILNGNEQGKSFEVHNTYTWSRGMDQRFYTGQQVFVNIYQKGKGKTISISHYKRDTYLLMLCWLTLMLLFIVMRSDGLRSIVSVILNFVLFLIVVQIDVMWNITSFFWIYAISAVIFTALTLMLVIGWNKQCLVTFIAIFFGTAMALLLTVAAMWLTKDKGMHYEALDFATQAPKQLFLSASVIGLLGTVMDAATDIVSTLFELKRSQPGISFKKLFNSGRQVGKKIMGPLINVLLLIFFAETFTLAVLYFRTGNSFGYTFEWTMSLGLVQAVISGIGITLVIPSASFLAAVALRGSSR